MQCGLFCIPWGKFQSIFELLRGHLSPGPWVRPSSLNGSNKICTSNLWLKSKLIHVGTWAWERDRTWCTMVPQILSLPSPSLLTPVAALPYSTLYLPALCSCTSQTCGWFLHQSNLWFVDNQQICAVTKCFKALLWKHTTRRHIFHWCF